MKPSFIAFKEQPNNYECREIVSLCPLNMKVDGVFLNNDGTLFRSPQLALAVYDVVTHRYNATDEEVDRCRGGVGFLDSVDGGGVFADEEGYNFLGYEYGAERGWTEEIEYLKRKHAQDQRVAIIRSIPMSLKDRNAVELLQFAQGSMDAGVLTIRSKQQRVIDCLAKKVDAIREAAEGVVGATVTITLQLDERKTA